MAKPTETAVAVIASSDFKALAVLGDQPGALVDLIKENIGSKISAYDLPRIKVPTGGGTFWNFQTAAGPVSTPYIEGIIALINKTKSFWEVSYDDAKETTPPDCSSIDCENGIGKPGGLCSECPYNEYGSDEKGDGKKCKDMADVFIITRDGIVPTAIQVPRTSLKQLKQYGITIMNAGLSIHDVVTKFSLHSEKKAGKDTAIIDMVSSGPVPDEMKAFVRAYKRDIQTLIEVSRKKVEKPVEPAQDTRPAEDGAAPSFS
jgi:hypothetical protein